MYILSRVVAHGLLRFVGHNMGSERLYRRAFLPVREDRLHKDGGMGAYYVCTCSSRYSFPDVSAPDSPRPQSCETVRSVSNCTEGVGIKVACLVVVLSVAIALHCRC